jgi:UDP-N-acetylmuramoyl-tripeptide--D-alanyl-D-alanine ligase
MSFLSTETLYPLFLKSRKVSTDSRVIEPASLFFALKGTSFDGNRFAREALEKGAAYAIIDNPEYKTDDRCLLVEDSLLALQDLARHHRRMLKTPIIGITGSNGKTTNKELFYAVLSQHLPTQATRGNLNNHIGVPLTLLELEESTEIAVVEMGANKVGDIQELVSICEPDYGMITNIGKAHLEGFGGLEGVRRGKGELYDFIFEREGVVFVNSRDLTLMQMIAERLEKTGKHPKLVHFPAKGDFYHGQLLEAEPFLVYEDEKGKRIETHLIGLHNFINIMASLTVGKYFGVPSEKANHAIASYVPENNRSQVIQKGSNTIVLDAYNANPNSMEASLSTFASLDSKSKVVILGDMNELGESSDEEHLRIGELLAQLGFDTILLCGKKIQAALPLVPKAYYFLDKFSLNNWLMDHKLENSHILIKASRGMALETIIDFL